MFTTNAGWAEFLIVRAVTALGEEVLRYERPIDIAQRVMADDGEIGGCPVRATQAVTTVLRAADRDSKVYEDPEVFAIDAKRAPHWQACPPLRAAASPPISCARRP